LESEPGPQPGTCAAAPAKDQSLEERSREPRRAFPQWAATRFEHTRAAARSAATIRARENQTKSVKEVSGIICWISRGSFRHPW